MKKLAIIGPVLLLVAIVVIYHRHAVMYQVMKLGLGGEPPALIEANEESPETTWFDDYYTVEEISPDTWAIGEPRYYQQNFNYLLVGNERALLFDAGPGVRNILPVVRSLTDLPVVFLPSHFHYDHVGNGVQFESRAVVDLPYLRERSEGNELIFTDMEHLGPVEGFPVPTWQVDHWWAPGQTIDLGGRSLHIVHTPGHSPESISLWDADNNFVLSGDYIYPGSLFVFIPGSSMQEYLTSADRLLRIDNASTRYFTAHRSTPPGVPVLEHVDLVDLKQALVGIRDGQVSGEGLWPRSYPVNDRISILADPVFLHDWNGSESN